jgi:hypothetical protein
MVLCGYASVPENTRAFLGSPQLAATSPNAFQNEHISKLPAAHIGPKESGPDAVARLRRIKL